jgi:hypothetical protein
VKPSPKHLLQCFVASDHVVKPSRQHLLQ